MKNVWDWKYLIVINDGYMYIYMPRWIILILITSLNPRNVWLSVSCSTTSEYRDRRNHGETKGGEKNRRNEVSNHDNWPSFALFRFLHADTASPHSNVFGSMLSDSSEWRLEEGRGSPPCELCSFPSPFTRSYIPRLQGWKWETLEISGRVSTRACQVERDKIRQI